MLQGYLPQAKNNAYMYFLYIFEPTRPTFYVIILLFFHHFEIGL